MKTKDAFILFAPIAVFIIIAVTAISTASLIQQRLAAGDSHDKFEAFVQNVESGKWQLTTDRWLEGMRLQQTTAEAYLSADAGFRKLTLDLAWAAALGILFQVAVILHVRRRLMPNNSLQATAAAPSSCD